VILPYLARLVCLSLACFFFVSLLFELAVFALTGAASRLAAQLPARSGARLLFALRLTPLGFAVCSVACLCIPSYLRMEPDATDEPVGWLCLTAAMLACAIWIRGAARGLNAVLRSRRYIRQCQASGSLTRIPGESLPVWVMEGGKPLMALSGILRPRLILSRQVMDALSAEELASALRHEQAHRLSHDNLKRLALVSMPRVIPFTVAQQRLEKTWTRFAEWAADDMASQGNALQSLTLATTLVRVARIDAIHQPPELLTALVGCTQDLEVRVDRLLRGRSPGEMEAKRFRCVMAGCSVLIVVAGAALLRPETQLLAHELLEHLVH